MKKFLIALGITVFLACITIYNIYFIKTAEPVRVIAVPGNAAERPRAARVPVMAKKPAVIPAPAAPAINEERRWSGDQLRR